MKKSNKVLQDELRLKYTTLLAAVMTEYGEEVLMTGSNQFSFPVVDSMGNERWVQIFVKIPIGSREKGGAYDGYAEAKDYEFKLEEQRKKREKKENEQKK